MAKQSANILDSISVASPCSEDWNEMRGSDQARFCSHCAKDVHDLSAITRKQAKKIVAEAAQSGNKICVRYVRKPNGQIKTAEQKLYKIGGRTAHFAASVLGATLTLTSATYAQGEARINLNETANVSKTSARKPKPEGAPSQISFTIIDQNGAVIQDAQVMLTNQKTNEKFVILTNSDGVAHFQNLARGRYELNVEGTTGFRPLNGRFIEIQNQFEPDIKITLEVAAMIAGDMIIADWYESPLSQTIARQDFETARRLILEGANVHAKEINGATALHAAVEAGSREIAELLLNARAKVNAKNKSQQTPLLMIDEDATPELVRLLIERGANVNARDNTGETALMKAADADKLEIVRILLESGADANAKDNDGGSVLSYANDEEIEKLLKSYGAIA